MFGSNNTNKIKCLNNSFLDLSNVVSMQIVEVLFPNPQNDSQVLVGYKIKALTDFNIPFDIFEDLESGTNIKCINFINDNWKCKNKIELAGKHIWLDLDKVIATQVLESFELDATDKLKLNYVARINAITTFGFSYEMASYVRPKGVDNNLNEIEKFRLKYLK